MFKHLLPLAIIFILAGCAGSANHAVVSTFQAGDTKMSCREIDDEIVRAQVLIDAIQEDKSDLSGADIIDGILWFPFNLIAKDGNYKNALSSADKRIERLENLKKEKDCKDTSEEMAKTKSFLSHELKEITKMYKNGDLTKEEYQSAKNKLLNK